jgi:hypothetical protein
VSKYRWGRTVRTSSQAVHSTHDDQPCVVPRQELRALRFLHALSDTQREIVDAAPQGEEGQGYDSGCVAVAGSRGVRERGWRPGDRGTSAAPLQRGGARRAEGCWGGGGGV